MQLSIQKIKNIINARKSSKYSKDIVIHGVAKIDEAKKGDLTFLANLKYKDHIYTTKASAVIVENNFTSDKSIVPELIYVKNPYTAFTQLLDFFSKIKFNKIGVSTKTEISKTATINKKVYIGAFCTIEENVKIGNNVKIFPNCYIGENTEIGENSIVFSGVKIQYRFLNSSANPCSGPLFSIPAIG